MNLETQNRKAFELVAEAIVDIEGFNRSKDRERLVSARRHLESAITIDNAYYEARFYDALVSDLIGEPAVAVERFEDILREDPPRRSQVLYNLGVAFYHQYSRDKLDRAISYFGQAINATEDEGIRLLCHAGLAQAWAMRIIPPDFRNPDFAEMQRDYKACQDEAQSVLNKAGAWGLGRIIARWDDLADVRQSLLWTAHNALGMAAMYHSDYFPDLAHADAKSLPAKKREKIAKLKEGLKQLEEADRYNPRDWANRCDLGSCHMRLGYWTGDAAEFEQARQHLNRVLEDLRPGYGFAYYEVGRTYRLQRRFNDAIRAFELALAVERKFRDVSDRRINEEIELARQKNSDFPFPSVSSASGTQAPALP
jgi:tetratricopeptide (TPR) repeat protein